MFRHFSIMDWKRWIGKRIFVKLNDSAVYSGTVIDVDNVFFSIVDKFGERVYFRIEKIEKIKEENND